jgi:hypothetical protein
VTRDHIKRQLWDVFERYLGVSSAVAQGLVPQAVTAGKLYEAHVLSRVVERLVLDEGYSLSLIGGTKIQLKSSPGPINRSFPRIELRRGGGCVAELWTDIEFLSLSYWTRRRTGARQGPSRFLRPPVTKGDYHELDIVIVTAGLTGRPRHNAIWLGIECKNTGYEKGLLKEILGIRRELSLLDVEQRTRFTSWPRATVPASPPSCLLVFSTDPNVAAYSAPGTVFGIDFVHEAM